MKGTLFIRTDLPQRAWLEYILGEFATIHLFQGKIVVVGSGEALPPGASVIGYTAQSAIGVCVPQRSGVLPTREVAWVEPGLYIVPGTSVSAGAFSLSYDLFWNAFVFLSGLEEHLWAQQGKVALSHCVLHPRRDKATFLIPVVNVLFARLEALVRQEFPHFAFGPSPAPLMDFSHDVDYLSKSPVFMFKQSVLNVYDLCCSVGRPAACLFGLKRALRFLVTRPSVWCFDQWRALEEGLGVRSIFYIHAKVRKGLSTLFIDPDYDLSVHARLQAQLRTLSRAGFCIGLHGSFYSARDGALMEKEKKLLEDVLGQAVTRGRQHWLRFVPGTTASIHERLLAVDSTLGWNDRVGYRYGCASAFHLYDHLGQRAFTHVEIPQVIMDFNVFQTLGQEDDDHIRQAEEVLRHFYASKSAHVSVSWHQQTFSPDYDWQGRYEKIVREYVAQRGRFL